MLSTQEREVCDLIARKQGTLLEDLKLHVGTPTGGGNLKAIERSRTLLTDRLNAIGATTELTPGDPKPAWLGPQIQIPSSSLSSNLKPGLRSVLIAGHLDTVHDPDGPFKELTIAPDGKTATGPGCVDMKGGLVIAVAALETLAEAGVECSWSFFLNADEETGTYHSQRALREASAKHDFGLAIEPALAGGELAIERVGSGQFLVDVRGKAAHVGRAFTEGISAVTKLGEILVKIGQMPEPERGMVANVGPITGGNAANAVPDHATAFGNVRFPDQAVADELGAKLDSLATSGEALPKVSVYRSFNRPAKPEIPPTRALAERAREVAEALGQSLPFAKTGGVCDGNIMQDAGLPTIDTLGVRGGGLHTPDEWIDLSSLVERCQLMAVLVMRLCQQ
ncbi:MAG: M20/M25/M40 family metallo-hydrolase [Phycisphaerales bacterium]|nr:M20/M25/M40 family metallo-hydrolase [Phycisphaerales bacterium]MCB9836380.1 M20/M25/M40 family metallo-hydrolase [Phycisphaera sp.]